MKVSAAGRAAIMGREGCRLTAYRDSVGVLTIGVGHTGRMAAPKVTAGMKITEAEADAFLAADLAPVEAAIAACVKVALTQNEFDACASLAFNIGTGGFEGSTVVHKLNAGGVGAAADAFLMWEKPAVLAKRREGERAEFLTPDGAAKPVVLPEVVAQAASTLAAYPAAPAPAPVSSSATGSVTASRKPVASASPGFFARIAAAFDALFGAA